MHRIYDLPIRNVIVDIEEALVAQWSLFGLWPGGELHHVGGLTWFENPIKHLPYNAVVRTRIPADADADAAIAELAERFRSRGVQFLWFELPDSTPADLGQHLAAHGLAPAEHVTCMSLELGDWRAPDRLRGASFEPVIDTDELAIYTALTLDYWEIPPEERGVVAELQSYWSPDRTPGFRYLARLDGKPVAKGYISLAGPPGVAAIYGMYVSPEARGRGIALGLASALIDEAGRAGCHRVVLHSTEMAVGVYRRLGFAEQCEFVAHATAAIWTDNH